MTLNVHYHPDGIVYVRTPSGIYAAERADFLADLQSAGVTLAGPFPATPFQYHTGVGYESIDDEGRHSMPDGEEWSDGEALIAAVGDLLAAKASRESGA